MNQNNVLKASYRAILAIALTVGFPLASLAQTAGEVAERPIEEIVVTGSRIQRSPTEYLLPTVSIDGDYLDNRGSLNLGEAINEIPLFSTAGNDDYDFNQAATDVGLTFVDLFGLGSERTLTVLNGRRMVSSSSPQPNRATGSSGLQVDINSIPTALVERIDTVTVGGAPIYGADAIAGVVNVIIRDDFEGFELDAQGSQSQEGDAGSLRGRLVYGRNLADGRGNIAVAIEYVERAGLLQTDRPGSADLQISHPMLATNPIGFFTSDPPLPLNTFQTDTGFPGVSAYGTPAVNLFGLGAAVVFGANPVGFLQDGASGDILMFDENGELIPVMIGDGNGTFLFSQNQPDFPGLFRESDYGTMLNDSERFNFMTLGHYDISDSVRLTAMLRFSELDAYQPIASPSVFGTPVQPGLPVSLGHPFLNPDARATISSGIISGTAAVIGFPLPFLALGPNFIVGRSLNDLSDKGTEASGNNWSAVVGLEGEFAAVDREWAWDLTVSQGRASSSNVSATVNAARFGLAVDAVMVDSGGAILTDPSMFADPRGMSFDAGRGGWVDSATGQQIVCRARVMGSAGASQADVADCLPYSPFGAYNTEETLSYLRALSTIDTRIDQRFLQGNLTGDLWDLPAGPIQFAAGFEYRVEESMFTTDPLTRAGGLLGGHAGTPDVTGDFDSTEGYAEFVVPIISNEIVRQFNLEGAFRRIDNSLAGADNVWTIGVRTVLAGGLTIRGNQTRSVRAPSIAELFAGQSPLFTGVADPCANSQINGGPNPSNRASNCAAAVVAAGLAPNETAAREYLAAYIGAIGGVPGTIGGNSYLENEAADSWTVGLTFEPAFLDRLAISLDYQNIEIEGAINNLNGSAVVAACYDSSVYPSDAVCNQFTRDPARFILTGYRAGFVNTGFTNFAGLTTNFAYSVDIGPGTVGLAVTWFRLDKYDTSTNGFDVDDWVELLGREKNRAQIAVSYSQGKWSATWQGHYVGEGWLDSSARDHDGTSTPLFEFARTDSMLTHNATVSYEFNERFSARLVINNLTEETQPRELRQFANVFARVGRTYVFAFKARL